ncbi:MAG: hypothetical protein EOO06_13425 [Chitinophagaceae bacterium]|nr:MAG: hypothetical protein EOO06_13425 [Chitinophagaceae bacterium]
MKKVTLLLENPFNDQRVTHLRLVLFAQNAHEALKDRYPDLAVLINGKVERLIGVIGNIGKTSAEGKGSGKALNAYKKKLHAFMKTNVDAFSVALGGRESMAFLSFFPEGLSEFTRLTHTEAPAVLDRLKKSVADYGNQLPDALRSGLEPLLNEWSTLRSSQQYLLESVDAKRADRINERIELELALLKAVHTVALEHLGEPKQSGKYFNAHMLVGKGRKKKDAEAA